MAKGSKARIENTWLFIFSLCWLYTRCRFHIYELVICCCCSTPSQDTCQSFNTKITIERQSRDLNIMGARPVLARSSTDAQVGSFCDVSNYPIKVGFLEINTFLNHICRLCVCGSAWDAISFPRLPRFRHNIWKRSWFNKTTDFR